MNLNREAWLQKAAKALVPHFTKAGYKFDPDAIRVSCGFPSRSALSAGKRRIGECWSSKNADDKRHQIFISPVLHKSLRVVDVLIHEIVHAVVGIDHGHDAVFKKCATAVGLEGKMTATTPSDALVDYIESALLPKLGEYPHSELKAMVRQKQTTRLLKCECPDCGYTVRTTAKWIEALGAPICPCADVRMEVK